MRGNYWKLIGVCYIWKLSLQRRQEQFFLLCLSSCGGLLCIGFPTPQTSASHTCRVWWVPDVRKKSHRSALHQDGAQPLVTFFASEDTKSFSASLAVTKDSVWGKYFIGFLWQKLSQTPKVESRAGKCSWNAKRGFPEVFSVGLITDLWVKQTSQRQDQSHRPHLGCLSSLMWHLSITLQAVQTHLSSAVRTVWCSGGRPKQVCPSFHLWHTAAWQGHSSEGPGGGCPSLISTLVMPSWQTAHLGKTADSGMLKGQPILRCMTVKVQQTSASREHWQDSSEDRTYSYLKASDLFWYFLQK